MHTNLLLLTDSYKISHYRQYPKGTTGVFSFLESRGGQFPTTTFFGLQYIIKQYLAGVVVTEEKIQQAKRVCAKHFGDETLFNEAGWRHILTVHGGRLPLIIKAVPEGTTVSVKNVLATIENTDPEVPWLTNYVETLLMQLWYPTTVCTQSRAMRNIIMNALITSGDPSLIGFKLHDFGFRGSTSVESSAIGGTAHLVNFMGTDTMSALEFAQEYYDEGMAGFSIPAAEHSTITSWGREHEENAYRNMLEAFPNGLVAVVSDSYDVFRACREFWGGSLREHVLNRNGTLVVRPDSGEPPEVVVQVLEILGEAFGFTVNAKGYKVLNPKVRVIQGDGIDYVMLSRVLSRMLEAGWSADNVAFGSGGGLLQKVNRDTQKFAIKCSAVQINGVWHDSYKDPVTDPGKRSKAGRLALIAENGDFRTVREEETTQNLLQTVFLNGELVREQSLQNVREHALVA
jgi:nicotinamide phosphoribosyltransferase